MLAVFAALAVLALAVSPRLTFDSDPLHTKNPNTEAMRTLRDLMDDPLTNPVQHRHPGADVADAATRWPRSCESCRWSTSVITLQSFVPEDQPTEAGADRRRQQHPGADAAAAQHASPPVTPGQIRLAAKTALAQIDPALPQAAGRTAR